MHPGNIHVVVTLVLAFVFLLVQCGANPLMQFDDHRLELDREVMENTISFLKSKLMHCMKTSGSSRGKKVRQHINELLAYEVDMGILENTRGYMLSRVLACRRGLEATVDNHVHQHQDLEKYMNYADYTDYEGHDTGLMNVVKSFASTTPTTASGRVVLTFARPTSQPEEKDDDTQSAATRRPPKKYNSLHNQLDETVPHFHDTHRRHFEVRGRTISCDAGHINADKTVLICINLLIDHEHRLPNRDVCPHAYNSQSWRRLEDLPQSTAKVMDVKGLCGALGQAAGISKSVKQAKVNWDCNATEKRIQFLKGRWSGFVDDNGFLHDIMCTFQHIPY